MQHNQINEETSQPQEKLMTATTVLLVFPLKDLT